MEKMVETVIKEIKESGSSKASQKDEVALMRAMLNDPTFACTNVDSKGNPVIFNPCETWKGICSAVVSESTGMTKTEAEGLVANYNVGNTTASQMIDISKNFINTAISTGRKVNLPSREDSKCTLYQEARPEVTAKAPKTGQTIVIPAFTKVKAQSTCPLWVKDKNK